MNNTPEKENARVVLKAINRHVRRKRIFEGGRTFGVDFNTWNACYPHIASVFNKAAEIFIGREGRFMPASLT